MRQTVEALEKAKERAGGREKGGVSVDIRVGMCIFTQLMTNPVFYFEIPVRNMDRAISFYSKTFDMTFERQEIDGNEMALFPYQPSGEGATGALAKGDSYKPSLKGTRVYFSTQDIDATLRNAISSGGRLIYPKTDTGDYGFVAEFEDSEGNCIALHMKKQ